MGLFEILEVTWGMKDLGALSAATRHESNAESIGPPKYHGAFLD